MISEHYRCVFIHIPKTAGTSIEKKLGHFQELKRGVQDHRTIREIEPLGFDGELFLRKDNLRLLFRRFRAVLKNIANPKTVSIPRHLYHSYFKFTFVRNSWARAFSWYHKVVNDAQFRRHYCVRSGCSFKDFLKIHLDQEGMKSQLYWILDRKGKNPLDFVGRFEQLETDFSYVCTKLGIRDNRLPILNTGDGLLYTDFYDDESIDIVADRYRDEIEYFDFRFGK